MTDTNTYYQRNRKIILNREKNIIKITKKYRDSKEEINTENYLKKKIRRYGRNRLRNLSKENKQRLREYQ